MRAFLIIGILLCFNQLHSQNITIRDKDTSELLELATVSSQNFEHSVVTNSMGQASVLVFKESDTLEIRMVGYTTIRIPYADLIQQNLTVYLSPSIFSIDQVVISATKWKQPSLEVPFKVRSISSSQISISNPQTAADLLGITGDVFIQKSQQGGGSPMIRGFATNRLVIVVDGVRMNNAIFRGGNLQNVISLDPFGVEKTEVLFGPGSVIYGSDAIGGVMNFYTLTPKFSHDSQALFSGNFVTRYSTANQEKTGHLHLNYGRKKWAMLTSLSYNNYDDLRMGSQGPDEYLRNEYVEHQGGVDVVVPNPNPKTQLFSGYSQFNLMQKIAFKPNDQWNVQYGFHYSETSNYDRYDRLIAYKSGLPRSAEWYYGPQIWMMNSINIANQQKTFAYDQLTINASHQLFKESRHDRSFNKKILKRRYEKVNAIAMNIDLSKVFTVNQRLLYGVEAIYNLVASDGIDKNIETGVESAGPSRYPQANWSSYALYFTYQSKVSEIVNLQAGARYNRFLLNAEFDNTFYPFPFTSAKLNKDALTGSLGITINVTDQWRINSNLSTGFRAPNVDDIGKIFDSSPGMIIIPNPKLNAEYALNAEICITRLFGDFLEIDLSGYYTHLDNAMVRRNATFNGLDSIVYDGELSRVQSIQNAAEARVWGLQADFELKFLQRFEFSSRVNYQKGEEELDDGSVSSLRHASPLFGVTSLSYSAKKTLFLFFVNYNGQITYKNLAEDERSKPHIYAMDRNGNPYSPSWYTLNVRAQYKISNGFSVSANVENITDQRYRTYSSGMVAPGINLIIAAKLSF